MKKFPVKYSVLINLLLISVALILCTIIVFNVIRVVDTASKNIIFNVIFIIFAGVSLIFLLSIVFLSRYKLSDEILYIYIGFFSVKINIKKIDKIIKYTSKREMFIRHFKNNVSKTHFVCLDFKHHQSFIDELLLLNPKINYVIED